MAKILVYSTKTCPYCQMLKKFLNENKIEFQEIDVNEDEEAANEMVEKSSQVGVPVTDINGKIIVGFDPEKIKKTLKLK